VNPAQQAAEKIMRPFGQKILSTSKLSGDKAELYHVKGDPYQMHNLAERTESADLVKRLSDWLHQTKL
jgi:hypothetical protein